ncbi:MAG: 7TM-DISM domain-containing protein [Flavobacteriaceae bacterium]|nr:7TM-DISM domain-containing protein [Flavobacteriaceae bacterium]
MKSVLILFTLIFCLNAEAKKKVHSVDVSTKSINLKSIENSALKVQDDSVFNDPDSVVNPSSNMTSIDSNFYYNNGFGNFGEGFSFSENSYKFVLVDNNSAGASLEDNSIVRNEASIDSHTIFRQGLYYGFAVMLVLLNLVCFFLFEEKTFLYYSLSLVTMSILLFFSDGLFSLLGLDNLELLLNNQTLFSFIATIFGALFVSKYLNLNEFLPKLKYITITLFGLSAILMAMGWASQNPIYFIGTNVVLFTILTTYFLAGIYLFSKKNYAKFLVIASFIPLLFCIDFFVLNPLGINFLSTQTTHIKAASIAEMLIITYAIMFRMQSIKEENIIRQTELRIFIKRQEASSVRKKTEKLVEDVYLENLIMHYDLDGLEIKLLQYISEGKENHKIARKLKTTEHEIEELTKDLYEKLEIGEQIQQDYRLVDSQPDYIYN